MNIQVDDCPETEIQYIESIFHPNQVEIVCPIRHLKRFYMVMIKTKHGHPHDIHNATNPFILIEEYHLHNHEILIEHIKTQLNRQIKTLQEYHSIHFKLPAETIPEIQEIYARIK